MNVVPKPAHVKAKTPLKEGVRYIFSISEAAQFLGVSIPTLRNWEQSGKLIPERTPGGTRRYKLTQLKEFLSAKNPYFKEISSDVKDLKEISRQMLEATRQFTDHRPQTTAPENKFKQYGKLFSVSAFAIVAILFVLQSLNSSSRELAINSNQRESLFAGLQNVLGSLVEPQFSPIIDSDLLRSENVRIFDKLSIGTPNPVRITSGVVSSKYALTLGSGTGTIYLFNNQNTITEEGNLNISGTVTTGALNTSTLTLSGDLYADVIRGNDGNLYLNATSAYVNSQGVFTGNGSGLDSLDAGKITSGKLNNDRLNSDVSKFGDKVDSSEIQDGTIQKADIGTDTIDLDNIADTLPLDNSLEFTLRDYSFNLNANGSGNVNTSLNGTGTFRVLNSSGTALLSVAPTGNTTLGGHFLPSTDATFDLGSPTQQWRNVYFSGAVASSGNIEIQNTNPTLTFTDTTTAEDDWNLNVDGSSLVIRNTTDTSNYLTISGTGAVTIAGVAEGTASLTQTLGDHLISDGDLTLSSGEVSITSPATTNDVITVTASSLSTGTALTLVGPSSTGVTDHFVKITADVSSTSLLNLNTDFTGNTVTAYGIRNLATDSTANENTDYASNTVLTLTGDAAKTGIGISSHVSSNSTTADTTYSLYAATSVTGAISTGTRNTYGLYSVPQTQGANSGGTTNLYGGYFAPSSLFSTTGSTVNVYGNYITNTGTLTTGGTINSYGVYVANGSSNTTGTSTKYGLYVEAPTGADTNVAGYFGGNVGIGDSTPSSRLEIGDGTDSLQISSVGDLTFVDADGAATITGPDGGALNINAANSQNLALATTTAGNITLTPAAATGLVNVLTGNLKVGNGSPTQTQDGEDFYVEGILEVDGTAYLDGAVFNGSNVTFGDATSDTITFTGRVNSSINPSASSTYDLGSASLKWNNVYAANGNFDNISGVVTGGSTTSATWTINSDNATSNAEISAIVFETNSTFDANMRWVASGDSAGNRYGGGYDNTITNNYPISIISEVSGGNTTFTGGSLFNYGQNATHAMTQASAFVGLDVDFSSNVTVPNSSSGNQTGALVTIKDGGASATAIGFQTAGTFDYGLDIGGTPGTADIRLSNGETIANTTDGTVTITTTTLSLSGTSTLNCTDCIDFDDMEDTLDLDTTLIVNQGTSTWTQNFTGDTTDGLTYNATSLTTGTALTLTGPTSTGVTDHFVKITADVGSAAALVALTPDFSGSAVTGYGIRQLATDATANANTNYGYYGNLTLTGNAAKTGLGIYQNVETTSTTADTLLALDLATAAEGIITTGTRAVYGLRSQPAAGAESTGGTTNVYGVYSNVTADVGAGGTVNSYGLYVANGTSDTDGTSTKYGLYVEAPTGADTNYAAIFAGGNVGIGDTSPDAPLDIHTASAASVQNGIIMTNPNSSAGAGSSLQFIHATNTVGAKIESVRARDGSGVEQDLLFSVTTDASSYIDALMIKYDGSVGIGDTTPDAHFDIDSSATTGNIFGILSTSLTTGEVADITATYAPTDGSTNEAIDINLTHSPTTNADNFRGIDLDASDGTALANTVYNYDGTLTLTGNAAKTGLGIYQTVTSSSTTADTLIGGQFATSVTGIMTTGTRVVYGLLSQPSAGAESTGGSTNVYGLLTGVTADVGAGGTVNGYGLYVANGTFDTDGTSTQYGAYIETPSGADTNRGIYLAGGGAEFNGNIAVNRAFSGSEIVSIGGSPITAAATEYGLTSQPTTSATATTNGIAGYFRVGTTASAYTQTTSTGIWIESPNKGAGSTITTARGLYAAAQTAGGTNNYGVYIEAPSGGSGSNIGLYNAGTSTLVGATSFSAAASPTTNDGAALGTTALQWSDLFLAEGGVINWDNGDLTLTQTNNLLALAGGELTLPSTSKLYFDGGGDTYISESSANVLRFTAGGGDSLDITANYVDVTGANLFVNEDSNANMTQGLTINQGASDDEILALKSSDVAHGITGIAETDTYGHMYKYSGTAGGLFMRGFSEGIEGTVIVGAQTSSDTSRNTTATAAILLSGSLKSGTSVTSIGANGNILAIENNLSATEWIVDAEGDVWQNGGLTIAQTGLTVTAGGATITDTSNTVATTAITNNTATTLGASSAIGVFDIASTSLTTGTLMNLELTEGTLNGGYYLRAWDATSGAGVFTIGEDGTVVVTGSSGNTVTLASDATTSERAASARRTYQIRLSPEYHGSTLTADGANNTGDMTSDFCSEDGLRNINSNASPTAAQPCDNDVANEEHNYYSWTTTQGSAQDYDIWIHFPIPSDFSAWTTSGGDGAVASIKAYGWRTDSTNNSVQISVFDTGGTVRASAISVATGTAAWTQTTVLDATTGTWTAGSYATIQVHMTADSNDSVMVGEIDINYLSRFK